MVVNPITIFLLILDFLILTNNNKGFPGFKYNMCFHGFNLISNTVQTLHRSD